MNAHILASLGDGSLLGCDFIFFTPRAGHTVRERVTILSFDPEQGVEIARRLSHGPADVALVPLSMFLEAFPSWTADDGLAVRLNHHRNRSTWSN